MLRGVDALAELLVVTLKHELVQRRDRVGVLANLLLSLRVKDRETCVHVPFLAVDPQHDVNLDVLHAPHVPRQRPGKLPVSMPRFPHGQKRRVGRRLRVSRDQVVVVRRQVDVFRAEAREDGLDFVQGFV